MTTTTINYQAATDRELITIEGMSRRQIPTKKAIAYCRNVREVRGRPDTPARQIMRVVTEYQQLHGCDWAEIRDGLEECLREVDCYVAAS